jgi:brefeldin A-resistance guanine nucleotide exchange factor 1
MTPLPLREKPVRPARKPDPVKESGLFSTLSSYLSNYATDEPSPPSDEEIERTMCTVDCMRSCHFEEVSRNLMYVAFEYADFRKLGSDASKALMTALLESVTIDASEDSRPISPTATAKADVTAPINDQESKAKAYDPSILFLLEMGTSLAIRDEESMRNLSAEVAGYCTEILRQRKHLHPIQLERSLIYLLALKKRGHETVGSA